jgi:hypothetical protein
MISPLALTMASREMIFREIKVSITLNRLFADISRLNYCAFQTDPGSLASGQLAYRHPRTDLAPKSK